MSTSRPTTPKELTALERRVATNLRHFSNKANAEIIAVKEEQRAVMVESVRGLTKFWKDAVNTLSVELTNCEKASEVAALITAAEKVQANLGALLNAPLTETANHRQTELQFRLMQEKLKQKDFLIAFFKKSGIELEVTQAAVDDMIIEAGEAVMSAPVPEDQSKYSESSESGSISSVDSEIPSAE